MFRSKYIFASSVIFVLASLTYFHQMAEFSQDLGRHILLGQIILQTHQVPKTNLFSYTYPNFPFINSHWLSEVIFYLLYHFGGFYGLFFPMIFIAAVGITILFFFLAKWTSIFTAFICTLFSLTIFSSRALLRPEVFSYLFLCIFLVILYKNRKQATKWLFFLPILELLWVNMHINFPIGVGLVGIFLLDAVVCTLKSKKHTLPALFQTKSVSMLAITFFLCLVATCMNPYGVLGAIYPLTVFSNYGYTIVENQSLFLLISLNHWPASYWSIFIASGLLFTLCISYWRKLTIADVLLVVIFTYGAFSADRNGALFALGTLPILTKLSYFPINSVIEHFKKRFANIIIGQIIFAAAGVLMLLWFVQATYGFGLTVNKSGQDAADFLITNHIQGPIFNNFDIGSYLDYRLYPQEKVFVDGRPEAYPATFFQNIYIPMQENPNIFAKEDTIYHFNTIFFTYTDQTPWAAQFVANIIKNPEWKLVYLDSSTMVLIKNNSSNQALIQKLAMSQDTLHLPDEAKYSMEELNQLAFFFQEVGWNSNEITTLQYILAEDPRNCMALQGIAQLFASEQNITIANIYGQKYEELCH